MNVDLVTCIRSLHRVLFKMSNYQQASTVTHSWRKPIMYTVSQKNCATFSFTVTLANFGRFLKFFQCRNQKEMAHNMNEKFPNVA